MSKDTFKVDDLGISLSDKSIKLICARKKKDIVLATNSKTHINQPIFLCGKQVYGIIELNQPLIIEDYQFKNRYKRHFITEEDREKYWSNIKKFYIYSFRIKRIFKEPLAFIKDSGEIGFMNSVNFNLDIKNNKNKREINFYKFYDEIEELEKLASIEGYEGLKNTLLVLYKLLVQRSELKYKQKKNKCTAADIKAGRCKIGQIYRHSKYDNYDDLTGFIKKPDVDITDKYIRIRLREPETIVKDSFKTITLSAKKGIKAVIGKLKSDPKGSTHVQSVLFVKDKWTSSTALAWVANHRESLKQGIIEGIKEKTNKSVTPIGKVDCYHCEKTFNFKKEEWMEDLNGLWLKCPYCQKEDYYEKIKQR